MVREVWGRSLLTLMRCVMALLALMTGLAAIVATPAAAQNAASCTVTYDPTPNAATGTKTLPNLRVFGTTPRTIFVRTPSNPESPAYACGFTGGNALTWELTKPNGDQFRSATSDVTFTFSDGAVLVMDSGGTVTFKAPPGYTGTTYRLGGAVTITGTNSGSFVYTGSSGPSSFENGDYRTGATLTITHGGFISPNATPPQFLIDVTTVSPATITSISPSAGSTLGGTSITIAGTGFSTSGNSVTVGGTTASITSESSTQIVAATPSGTAGAADVVVTTGANEGNQTATGTFTYVAPSTVTALSPTAGPTAGNTVILSGTNFLNATAVTFGATPATSFTVNSATQITAAAPAGSGTVNVRVTTAAGTSPTGAGNQYTYIPAPVLTSVSPSSGAAGANVILTGSNLNGATAVLFGATAATSYTVNSNTQITAVAPTGVTGTVNVSVSTVGGTATLANAYSFAPAAPVVTAPANGTTTGSQPIYSGTAQANSTVTVYVDSSSIGTTTVNGAGAWSLT
ncbi:IPT/TIG domain-containing protein, partial [uncultured Sphingomonas sp.]|uniref:beta strand repeat-containing protein n=1 Tax=uncultured Sphingomonas sp. TaxID=158754 RepID=UPI002600BCE5